MEFLKGCIVVMALWGVGCFAPSGRDCAVTCSPAGGCPSGFMCLADGYCHEEGDRQLCGVDGNDGGGQDSPDPGIDAAPQMMTMDFIADADTYIHNPQTNDNFGSHVAIGIDGETGAGRTEVGLVHFDLSAIPAGAPLQAAPVLRVCSTDDPLVTGSITIYRVLEQWSEGTGIRYPNDTGDMGQANWNERAPAMAWTTAGVGAPGSRDATPATVGGAVLMPTAPDTAYSVESEQSIVEGWIADPSTNNGFALVPSTDADDGFLVSREGTAVADCEPRLTVVWLQ